jgi:hypothetical protein
MGPRSLDGGDQGDGDGDVDGDGFGEGDAPGLTVTVPGVGLAPGVGVGVGVGCGVGGGTEEAAGGGWVAGMIGRSAARTSAGSPGDPPLTGLPGDSTSRYPNEGCAKLSLPFSAARVSICFGSIWRACSVSSGPRTARQPVLVQMLTTSSAPQR